MRKVDIIDSRLQLLAAMRRVAGENDTVPSIGRVEALPDDLAGRQR